MSTPRFATAFAITLPMVAASTAVAQPGLTQPTSTLLPPPAVPAVTARKSEQTATDLAIGGTALPLAFFFAAGIADDDEASPILAGVGAISLMLTPSMGHWYAGKIVTPGMGMRVAGGVATLVGGYIVVACLLAEDAGCNDPGGLGAPLLLGGLASVVAGVIYDLATADNAVRDFNAAHAARLTITPTVARHADGRTQGGLAVAGAF